MDSSARRFRRLSAGGLVARLLLGGVARVLLGPDTIRFEIAPAGGGDRCTLTLIDTLQELGKAVRDGAGWHACLDALQEELEGRAVSAESSARWAEVHPGYVQAFGPAAATIGPPEAVVADRAAGS